MIEKKFNFKDIFVFDLANNHQGSVSHAMKIIDYCHDLMKRYSLRAAIKFQFRDLPNFIHSNDREKSDNKHVSRFLSTKLDWKAYSKLKEYCHNKDLITICTPFDEKSVEKIIEMNFDIIKIASCSSKDWPLIEEIAKTNKPIIASTGGLLISEVDDLVSFFVHRKKDFALMHCVAIYPTPDNVCNLYNIKDFIERYPNVPIGWSTHENPKDNIHVIIAKSLGASLFERHIGLRTNDIELNAYSSDKEDLENWIKNYLRTNIILGNKERTPATKIEQESLESLERGVYVRENIKPGDHLHEKNIYFSFPIKKNQLSSGKWKSTIKSLKSLKKNEPYFEKDLDFPKASPDVPIKKAIHKVKAMLSYAKISLPHEFTTEYSHHYGIKNFFQVGVTMITIINREYAKKILVQLPNQYHPSHFHKKKEETFIVLWGELISNLDDKEYKLYAGDKLTVLPGIWHNFKTEKGCIFEEISTTAYKNDSVYRDNRINKLTSSQRKTVVDHWGTYQIDDQIISMDFDI